MVHLEAQPGVGWHGWQGWNGRWGEVARCRRTGLPRVPGLWTGLLCLALLAPVAASGQNLVSNPLFHQDTAGWDLELGTQLLWTNLTDEGGCGNSGSALVSSALASGQYYASLSQCISVGSEPVLHARVRHQGYGTFTLRLEPQTTLNCTGGPLGSAHGDFAQSPVQFQEANLAMSLPLNANSVFIYLVAIDADPHGLLVDGVYAGGLDAVFFDDFDGNDEGENLPCRWSP